MTKNSSDWLPVSRPVLTTEDEVAVAAAVKAGWISSAGPAIEQFEKRWSAYCDMQFGVAVSSGTAALQVALDCLQLQAGDEVILPSLTIISCALAVLRTGAIPVPVECDAHYQIDAAAVAAAITAKTRAIMVVHLFGHPVDMAPLWQLAGKHGLRIIEDAAQAHGAEYCDRSATAPRWRRCGGLGTISVFSFYANKTITTGEGGMLLTNDPAMAAHARSLRNLGFGAQERFRHERLAYNFRMTNLQAALGVSQLGRIDSILRLKQEIKHRYDTLLRECQGIDLLVQQPWARNTCWMYPLVVSAATGVSASELAQRLASRGIETRPFFLGLHAQPALRQLGLFEGVRLPITESLYERGLYIPSGIDLTPAQQERVAAALMDSLESR